jgi:signal peptide peptidase SppA
MHPLPHLATRIFDTPLLIAPQKLEVILAALAPRLGIEAPPVSAVVSVERASRKPYEVTPDGIAIIPVEGTLVHKTRGIDALSGLRSYVDIQQEIEDAATDPTIKGILLEIDSPGGEVAGAFDVADTVYSARATKPLIAVANNDAFSAAYLLASAAQRIYVSRTSGVGSVGVIVSHLDMSGNDEKMGYRYTIVSAGARKADFNPHAPLSEEAKSVLEGEIARTYGLLVNTVARNRGLPEAAVRGTEAGLFFGSDALNVKFADRLGTRQDALADLRAVIAPAGVSIQTQGRTSMHEEPLAAEPQPSAVNLDAIRAEARRQGYADAREIVELCALAGMPARAAALLTREVSPADARQHLMEARAAEDATEVRSHVMPDTGTSVKANPENNPVLKAVERLAGKGVN